MAEAGNDGEHWHDNYEYHEIFALQFGEPEEVERLSEAENEDAGGFLASPDQNGVGEEGKEECEREFVVALVFLHGIDSTEEDAGVFKYGGTPEAWRKDVERQKAEVNYRPGGHPITIEERNAFNIRPPGPFHSLILA